MNLAGIEEEKIVVASGVTSTGTTTVTSDTVDCAGFDEVEVEALLETATDGSVPTLTVLDGDASNGSDKAAITGATATTTAASLSKQILAVTVIRPKKRYLTATLARATQAATVSGIIFRLRKPKIVPVTQGSSVLASTKLVSPS